MKRAPAFRSRPGRPWILYGDSHRIFMLAFTGLMALLLLAWGLGATINGALIAADPRVLEGEVAMPWRDMKFGLGLPQRGGVPWPSGG